ncbi:MAG: methionyl-tRNA synthetase [Parcubacteria bacterium C7867-008]|nr:MAG: methionyl-tRNA synthetase [Parcubacteria bacterium C7867-008]
MARYITTTLPYVNADPHIGFAVELIQADILTRIWRQSGETVFFNTGTDEHGQKILQTSEKEGRDIHEYVDHFAAEFERLNGTLGISNSAFVRTTNPAHIEAAQEMWRRCHAKGDIYKKAYSGLYCVGCESFKTEKDIEDGRCMIHTHLELQEIVEENYFFRLSKYQDAILEYLDRPNVIVPEWRREEALNFVRGGLEDFSISRDVSKLTWGIPVPDDDTQVMYVWFDALTSYISTLGWPSDPAGNFETYWNEGKILQLAGKDQVRFQSVMWQAMLMSADIKNTDQVFYHGFINSGGQKMSKSLGNVISPYELVEKYGREVTRYLLLRHVHPVEDSDVTWERMDEWYTANLVNGLGNLVSRVMKLAETHLSEPVQLTPYDTRVEEPFIKLINVYEFQQAMDLVFDHITKGDEYMTTYEPYKKIKDPETEDDARTHITQLVRHIAKIAAHLESVMPETSTAILTAVRSNTKPENLFPRLPA